MAAAPHSRRVVLSVAVGLLLLANLFALLATYDTGYWTLNYAAWAEPHTVRCAFVNASNNGGIGRAKIGTSMTSGTITATGMAFYRLRVKCR